MPIYEVRFQLCGNQFEKLIRTKEAESGLACETCGNKQILKLISAFAFSSSSGFRSSRASGSSCSPCAGPPYGSCR